MNGLDTLWVALGGSAGAVARFRLDQAIRSRRPAAQFPLAILVVNVTGSLLLGFVVGLVLFRGQPAAWRTIVGTGFCGGYTTFSTAGYDTVALARKGAWALAAMNSAITILSTIAAGALGLAISML